MNKSAFQPLPVLLRAEPNDARGTSHSAMILRVIATLGTLFALGGTVVLCLIAFNAFPPKTLESKVPVTVPNLSATKVAPTDVADQENGVGMPATKTNPSDRAVTADDHSIIDQTPTPALNPTSPPAPVASASDRELLDEQRPEAGPATLDRQFSESSRRTLEKKRRAAERQRSRLEKRYQEHAISSDEYKKGQENYRMQIDQYRRAMSAYRGPDNEVGQD
jgi:hypothetical protein